MAFSLVMHFTHLNIHTAPISRISNLIQICIIFLLTSLKGRIPKNGYICGVYDKVILNADFDQVINHVILLL